MCSYRRLSAFAATLVAGLAMAAAADPASAQVGDRPLKVAILLPGAMSDNGYNADGGRTAEAIRAALGAETQVTENVSVANQADLYRQYAATGSDLVIGWGGQFTDGAVQVSQEFPDVKFLIVNGNTNNDTNLASLDIDIEQWEFLGGYVTAKLSTNGVVAWIGGQCFPATAANLHGVEQGARHANPDVRVLSTFTGDFEDPIKAQQAAQAMFESGSVTALTGNLNNGWFGVFKAAQEAGNIPVVTEWVDNSALAPDVIHSSINKSQSGFVLEIARSVAEGSFAGGHHQFGLTESWDGAVMVKGKLPDELYEEAVALQAKLVSGEIEVARDESCP